MTRAPLDSTIPFLREGYPFVSGLCDRLGTDLVTSRLALVMPVTFIRGADAAGLFYDGEHFNRKAAMPPTVKHLLQDAGSVQTLTGSAHERRKHRFLVQLAPERMDEVGELYEREWRAESERWKPGKPVKLQDAVDRILTRVACEWSGVPLSEKDLPRRAAELSMMVSRAGSIGPTNWYAQWRRRGTERWIRGVIEDIRSGALTVPADSAAAAWANAVDDSDDLTVAVAAVELINILRPIVAVTRFVLFAAVALHQYPQWRERFASGDESDLEPFVQEVRRLYPFFPVVPGRVLKAFDWHDHRFSEGDLVVLDLYGTCHDRRLWEDPDSFRPERMRGFDWSETPNTLVAQGAGEHENDHRCPGEWTTVELLKRAVRMLAAGGFSVPTQDLTIPLSSMPTAPRSGFVVIKQ